MWTRQSIWAKASLLAGMVGVTMLFSGCAATSILSFAYEQANKGECVSAGCAATAVISYAIDKATEGDPTPCHKLNTVERALSARCGKYWPGSLLTKDVIASGLPKCPLTLAARDPKLWPILPELLSKGATPDGCDEAPLVALSHASPCPDFPTASFQSLHSLRRLAVADARSIHHDVVRMLSCPAARTAGLDTVLETWLAQGRLPSRGLSFGVLSALHPDYLATNFARSLEAQGHTAGAGLGAYNGQLPSGFDLALKDANFAALDWWLDRVPTLANHVPPRQANQMAWLPLVRVLTPTYLSKPEQQPQIVAYLISRGADPSKSLPHDPGRTVINYAQQVKSPSLAILESPRLASSPSTAKVSAAATGAAAAAVAAP